MALVNPDAMITPGTARVRIWMNPRLNVCTCMENADSKMRAGKKTTMRRCGSIILIGLQVYRFTGLQEERRWREGERGREKEERERESEREKRTKGRNCISIND